MMDALTLYQQDTVLKKGAEKLPGMKNHGERHPRPATAEHVDVSKKDRSKDRAAAVYSLKGSEEKGEDCRSWTSKLDHDLAKKEKGKGT